MSQLVVVTFDSLDEAGRVCDALHEAEAPHRIRLDDLAVVVKGLDGQVEVRNVLDRGVKVGALTGGLLGLVVGLVLGGPVGSLVVGTIAGALSGDLAGHGIDGRFVRQVSETLQPGTSALFIMVRDEDPQPVIAALEPYQGTVYHTSFPPEVEDELRRVLDE